MKRIRGAHPHAPVDHELTGPLRPPRPAIGLPLLPDGRTALPKGNPCEGCDHCCRYFSLEIDAPRAKRDFDNIRWYILHKNVSVMVDWEGSWLIQFDTPCEWLKEGQCSHYTLRPDICREYDPVDCERYAGPAEKIVLRTPDDLDRFVKEWEAKRRSRRARRAARAGAAAGLAVAALALLLAGGAWAQAPGDREGLRSGPRAKRDGEIHWREWGPAAFAEAKRTNRLVLLDLTAVWCHWCHVMDETSYSDSSVIRLLNTEFVPIRVDSDKHPEVRDRYVAGGWPTTAVLSAEGHVLVSQTYLQPAQLKQMLGEVHDLWRKNRLDVDRKVTEAMRNVRATWKSEPIDSASLVKSDEIIERTIDALRDAEDKTNGGFSGPPRFHDADAVTLLLRAGAARGDAALRASAIHAVQGLLRLQDSVWGGFYRYATQADWSRPHYEKMLEGNALAIQSCLEAYRATGERRFLDAAKTAERYVGRWLWDDRSGGYFGSHDADVGSHDSTKPFTAGEDFYILSGAYRRKLGAPSVDSTFYADANARMASAFLRGVLSGVWDRAAIARPLRALDRMWRNQRAPDGSLYHALARGRAVAPGLLGDQALAALAYLDAYEVTGDTQQLARARSLAEWIRARLEDRVGGGFRYAPYDSSATGRLLAGDKPPEGNIDAATLFLRLYWLEERAADRASADGALAWLRSGGTVEVDPARALVMFRGGATPVRIAVVGSPRSDASRALAQAAFRADAPEKVIRFYEKGGSAARWGDVQFPASPSPALYLCGERVCAPPVTDPAKVDAQVRSFLAVGLR